MKEEIISIETLKELQELKKQKQEALEFIEKRCTYDDHLQGYCMGLTPGEVKILVLKLGGKKEV
jgi:hypothetical protein